MHEVIVNPPDIRVVPDAETAKPDVPKSKFIRCAQRRRLRESRCLRLVPVAVSSSGSTSRCDVTLGYFLQPQFAGLAACGASQPAASPGYLQERAGNRKSARCT